MAHVARNKLKTRGIQNLEPGKSHTDGGGLMLRVQKNGGRRSWVLRLTVDGKRRTYGLGGYPEVSIREARGQAAKMRERARGGLDPIPQPERPQVPTFSQVAETVIEIRRPTWSNERHATQWRESLKLHVLPAIGNTPVDTITTADVLALLRPIWTAKPETASRVRQRLAVIFDFAVADGRRTDNPCSGVKAALPPRSRQRRHHPALPYPEVSEAVSAIRESSGRPATKLALEFIILTAARTGEVRLATWDEIDLESATWNLPAEHMKMRRPHRVPLSTGALDLLGRAAELSDRSGLIFPSNRNPGRPLSNMAFEMMLRRLDYGTRTSPHGFRSSFRTWALEASGTDWALAELALAHNLGGGEVIPYVRSDLLDQRRPLMQSWCDYLRTD